VFAIAILAGAALIAAMLEPGPTLLSGRATASDGDSLRLGGERIRLIGLDAPELDQTCRDAQGQDWPCGREARTRLAGLLAQHALNCQSDSHDRYGRRLAVCTAGTRDVAAEMVRSGLAVASDAYHAEEREARNAGRGIWAGSFTHPRAWREDAETPSWEWLWKLFG
jgi:endonuclease YncB( thermonuclease family)